MPRTTPMHPLLFPTEEELLKQCLRTAYPQADSAKALADTRRLISRYLKRIGDPENPIPPGIEAERALTLWRHCFHLVRFLHFADARTQEIGAEALRETNIGDVETLSAALQAVSERAMWAARVARKKIGPGAPVQRNAERELVFELARIFTSTTHTTVSASKSKPYVKGSPLVLRSAEKASRQFVEVVLRDVLSIPEVGAGDKGEGVTINQATLLYWLREARQRIKAETSASRGQ